MASSEEYKDQQKQLNSELAKRQAYFHIDWHPQNPSAQEIQQLFSSTVLTPPGKTPFNQLGPGKQDIPLDALVIANHRTPNLGDYFSYRKLSTRDGPSISSFMKWGPIFFKCWRKPCCAGFQPSICKKCIIFQFSLLFYLRAILGYSWRVKYHGLTTHGHKTSEECDCRNSRPIVRSLGHYFVCGKIHSHFNLIQFN